MSQVFTLRLPTDAAFHALAAEAGGRICVLGGGDTTDAEAIGAELVTAIEELRSAGESVVLEFETDEAGVQVRLTCGDRRQSLKRTWSKPVR